MADVLSRRQRGATLAGPQRPRTGGASTRVTKADRKEQARLERIEIQRRMARTRRNRTIATAAVLIAGLAIVGVVALTSSEDQGQPENSAQPELTGLMTGPEPWPANLGTLADRMTEISIPTFGNPLAMHEHAHLDLFVNGSPVTVPASIGFGPDVQAALHTHDTSGVVHMESNQADATFTLGEFFDVWGLRFTGTCIGGYCEFGDRQLRLFVDGKPSAGDPRLLRMHDQQEIVVTYGSSDQVPDPLPTFDWASLTP
jgi:hypothetical protein